MIKTDVQMWFHGGFEDKNLNLVFPRPGWGGAQGRSPGFRRTGRKGRTGMRSWER
jgi:hypothetical protein